MFYGGVSVTVTAQDVKDAQGGVWCEVCVGDLTGYMKRQYLSFLSGDFAFEYPLVTLTATANEDVGLETGDGTLSLPTGSAVQLLGAAGDRYYVKANERYGWLAQKFVTILEP